LDIGSNAPGFNLKSFEGDEINFDDFKDKIVVIEATNPGCPYVKKHYENGHMQKLQNTYREKGVVWLSVNSTNTEHKNFLDSTKAKEIVQKWKINPRFMLVDSDGKVGKAYGAKTTPHMFIINQSKLVYQGAIDDNSDYSSNPAEDNNYVVAALDQILTGKAVSRNTTKQYGCSVKY